MKRAFRTILLFAGPLLILSACAGNVLHIPGDLTRPARPVSPVAGATRVAVADFSHTPAADNAVGRDFDHARPIVWKGEPGKAMADLVAGVLAESGVATARRAEDASAADGVPVRISGVVRRFEVNSRRTGGTVVTEATVTLVVTAEGPGLSGPYKQTVTSSTSLSDLFVTPDDPREALLSAANTVAEEVVRKLLEAKVVPPPS